MSFKVFIYYCALCGGWAAFLAFLMVQLFDVSDLNPDWLQAPLTAAILGVWLGIGIGATDAVLNSVGTQRFVRVGVCLGIGLVGGFISGLIGQFIRIPLGKEHDLKFIGWALVGLTIGAAVGAFDMLRAFAAGEGIRQSLSKVINGVLGGTLGGVVGGLLYDLLDLIGLKVYMKRTALAVSMVILGGSIGLLIGLAQVFLKEAWIKVEQGFRAGREMILTKPEVVIGRGEGSDIGLFGDNSVEKIHAKIMLKDNRYMLSDAGTAVGTFLNGQRIEGITPLRGGDAIQVGKSVLRFEERQKS